MNYRLHNNLDIPCIGFGTWKLKDGIAQQAVEFAIDKGYRHIDTAFAYGNEEYVGLAISKSSINRSELFVSGKLWNTERSYYKVINAFHETLKKLKLSYLDLYLIHWPASPAVHNNWHEINTEVWRALEKLYLDGTVRAIGVCNFKKAHLEALLKDADVMPMINQIEYHPGQLQPETVGFCKANNILVEAWSPLGSGKMLKVQALKEIAEKYNRSIAQICIRWCLQNSVLPLPKSKTHQRIAENINVFDFSIKEEDMITLNQMPYVGGSGLDSDSITIFG